MKENLRKKENKLEIKKRLPENLKAALIDMDGVLYDSMPYHVDAWHKMFKEFGLDLDHDEFYLYEGMTGEATIQMIIKRELGRDATLEEMQGLYKKKSDIFKMYGKNEKMPFAAQMLEVLKNRGINTVLVTGSAQETLLDNLNQNYPGFFPRERMVTAYDVSNCKPHPEPYLKGIEKANADKESVIVIENAPMGVQAGKAAGCFTVAVTTGPIPREEFEKVGADLIFPDMKAFAEWLDENLPSKPARELDDAVEKLNPDKTLIVTDTNVQKEVLSKIKNCKVIENSPVIAISPGEEEKNIESVIKIWKKLEEIGATRKSVVINIGGGMVTDTGGFAAATFKRGVRTVNFPTTLLGAVDAATGGKTGINFMGLKNEIGAFHQPEKVIISSLPIASLSEREIMSGYAEMVKTGAIADKDLYYSLLDVEKVLEDKSLLEKSILRCVEIKEEVVAQDPQEKGLRKILNFGHSAGHAFESLAIKRGNPVTHGCAVAHGMLVAMILSNMLKKFPSAEVDKYNVNFLTPYYPNLRLGCADIPELIEFIAHDKKNSRYGEPDFTLLSEIGAPLPGCKPSMDEVKRALEIYMDYKG